MKQKYISCFLISAGILCYEIVLTRIFSILIWYHFAFFVVSSALLGLSLSGMAMVFVKSWRESESILPRSAGIFGLCIVLLTSLVCYLPIPAFDMIMFEQGKIFLLGAILIIIVFVLAVPFFFAGLFLGGLFVRHTAQIGKIYGANLSGSAAGCLLALMALKLGGGPLAVIISGMAGLLGAYVIARGKERRGYLIVTVFIFLLIPVRQYIFPIYSQKVFAKEKEDIIKRRWNTFSCVDFFKDKKHLSLWGLSPLYQGDLPNQIGITIDSWALTSIVKWDGSFDNLGFYDYLPANLAYTVAGGKSLLVIGAGGGLDVLGGLRAGMEPITAVEINPIIVEEVMGEFADYSGQLYHHPNVNPVVAEGRHYLQTHDEKYDIIQLSGVDTLTATQAGAYSLSENYIYTVEAFLSYLEHLEPGGILTLTRWYLQPPVQTVRLCVLAQTALQQSGVQRPEQCMIVARSGLFSVLLVRREGFTTQECQRVINVCQQRGFEPVYLPGHAYRNVIHEYVSSPNKRGFLENYPYNVSPPTDFKPFFMEHHRWDMLFKQPDLNSWLGGQAILIAMYGQLWWMGLAIFFLPLLAFRGRGSELKGWFWILCYFACIGIGFMLVEIVLMQRFTLILGHPVYSLSIVLLGLLLFCGVGSYLSQYITIDKTRAVNGLLLAIGGTAYCYALVVYSHYLLQQGVLIRFAVVILGMLPLGLFMGMAFPLGMKALTGRQPLIAWSWGVNGWASIMGSVVAVMIAMSFGFKAVILWAGWCYFFAMLFLWLYLRGYGKKEEM